MPPDEDEDELGEEGGGRARVLLDEAGRGLARSSQYSTVSVSVWMVAERGWTVEEAHLAKEVARPEPRQHLLRPGPPRAGDDHRAGAG